MFRSICPSGRVLDVSAIPVCCCCAWGRVSDTSVRPAHNSFPLPNVQLDRSRPGGYSWAYNAQLYHDTYYPDFDVGMYLFITSIVGGSIGILVGGVVSDRIVKRVGVQARAWVLATSQVIYPPRSTSKMCS